MGSCNFSTFAMILKDSGLWRRRRFCKIKLRSGYYLHPVVRKCSTGTQIKAHLGVSGDKASIWKQGRKTTFVLYVKRKKKLPLTEEMQSPSSHSKLGVCTANAGLKTLACIYRERLLDYICTYARKRDSLVKAPFFSSLLVANVFSNRLILTSKGISVKQSYQGILQVSRYQSCVCRNWASEYLRREDV